MNIDHYATEIQKRAESPSWRKFNLYDAVCDAMLAAERAAYERAADLVLVRMRHMWSTDEPLTANDLAAAIRALATAPAPAQTE